MSNRQGWIKVHRKIWENPFFQGKPAYLSVWLWLLSEAQYVEGKAVLFDGNQVYLKAGQLTCGVHQIAKATGVCRGTVEYILKKFEIQEMIQKQSSNKCSLITITNWNLYQKDEEQIQEPSKSESGSGHEQVRTTEERKKGKNKKIKLMHRGCECFVDGYDITIHNKDGRRLNYPGGDDEGFVFGDLNGEEAKRKAIEYFKPFSK